MVKNNVYVQKFKGRYAISDYYGFDVLTCPNGIIGRSLSNPRHLSVSLHDVDVPKLVTVCYTALGKDFNPLKMGYINLTFTFPESQLDKLANVLKISKRGISSNDVLA